MGIRCEPITIYELLLSSVDSLRKLHRKMTSTNASLDDRGDLTSTRRVWGEIIDNVDRGKAFRTSFFLSLQMSPRVSNQRSVLRYTHHRYNKSADNVKGGIPVYPIVFHSNNKSNIGHSRTYTQKNQRRSEGLRRCLQRIRRNCAPQVEK